MAELWGLYEGMKLARKLKFNKVELGVDSIDVVQDFLGKRNIQRYGNNVLSKVLSLCELDWEVNIMHIHREANQQADAMVNFSFYLKKDYKEFVDCPTDFMDLFRADLNNIGVSKIIDL